MKSLFLPLFAITTVLVIAGIEIFQVDSGTNTSTSIAEIVYVIMLFIIISLSVYMSIKRSSDIKAGLPADDELSRNIIHRAGSFTFFVSLFIWLVLLIIEAQGNTESKYLFSFGLIISSFVFMISWAILQSGGKVNEKQD